MPTMEEIAHEADPNKTSNETYINPEYLVTNSMEHLQSPPPTQVNSPAVLQPIQVQPLSQMQQAPPYNNAVIQHFRHPQNILPMIPNCPPGLEYLLQLDQILVSQKVEMLEAFTGFETCNKYVVKNAMGQQCYYALENTGCLNRQCCGPCRSFDIEITDNMQNEVIHLNRPLACQSCCFPCCLQKLEVSSPPGNVIGHVNQEWSVIYPKFTVQNASGDVVLRIEGPFCTYSICGNDVEFKVLSADGSKEVGKISKQWSGFFREAFTDADHFSISFPMDLSVQMKAVLLGALFLIDFMFFEKTNNQRNDGIGMAS